MSKWHEAYKVHPAAAVFPMMSDDELATLGEDIKANGLSEPIKIRGGELLDGRNRLEAAERVGYTLTGADIEHLPAVDPIAFVISANLHRRHMLKSERADAIVALVKMSAEKPDQADPVSTGGRGKKSAVKAKALEINATLPKEQRLSEPTIKRAIAKAEGRTPKPARPKWARSAEEPKQTRGATSPLPKPRSGPVRQGLETARKYYLDQLRADPDADLDLEHRTISEALKEIAGARIAARARQ